MAETMRELLDFAHQLAWQAGKITLRYFQTDIRPDLKADDSPVTAADRECEQYLRAAIRERFPSHAVLGEEYGESNPGSSQRWIVDPIDGTRSFVRGVPLYGVMIGLEREGQPALGVINLPALGEVVYAAQGLGCYWNGRPCRVSSTACLADGLLVASSATGYERYGKEAALRRLQAAAGAFRTWGDCYGYVLVATGRAEAMLDPVMNVWDCAAALPILQEAGGSFGDWSGAATIHAGEGLATNGAVLEEVLRLIK
jgi:histidinol phosphatase-like enzyme (inositol monophosphatase family)